jgi:hypothetical protein
MDPEATTTDRQRVRSALEQRVESWKRVERSSLIVSKFARAWLYARASRI